MSYKWKEQREKSAFLALEDGSIFRGWSCGAVRDVTGEAVFNTGMSGYQEILSDPSYCGQFVVMTYPEIGNTGINKADMESSRFFANGLLIHEMNEPNNWRSEESLSACLIRNGIPAIAGLDTRKLTTKLREQGSMKGCISVEGKLTEAEAVRRATEWQGLDGQDYASKVTCSDIYQWDPDSSISRSWGIAESLPPIEHKIVVYDFGVKWNILRNLRLCGFDITVVPAKTDADAVLALRPAGVFLSNGPADPSAVTYAIEAASKLLGRVPMMGICLGHQILALAVGAKTYRLKFGHHGCNHPVKNLRTSATAITSQNHNFAVDPDTLDSSKVEITHINLNDGTVEGIKHKTVPMFAVQYHPEACPGPRDSRDLFMEFKNLIVSK